MKKKYEKLTKNWLRNKKKKEEQEKLTKFTIFFFACSNIFANSISIY